MFILYRCACLMFSALNVCVHAFVVGVWDFVTLDSLQLHMKQYLSSPASVMVTVKRMNVICWLPLS